MGLPEDTIPVTNLLPSNSHQIQAYSRTRREIEPVANECETGVKFLVFPCIDAKHHPQKHFDPNLCTKGQVTPSQFSDSLVFLYRDQRPIAQIAY